ncbi:MAG: hypothetical protein ACPLQP_02725 [Moorellaceae bacterium]
MKPGVKVAVNLDDKVKFMEATGQLRVRLYIYRTGSTFREVLGIRFPWKARKALPFLGLTNALLGEAKGILEGKEESAPEVLERFSKRLMLSEVDSYTFNGSNLEVHWEFKFGETPVPLLFFNEVPPDLAFRLEFLSIGMALKNWLLPLKGGNKKPPSKRYSIFYRALELSDGSPLDVEEWLFLLGVRAREEAIQETIISAIRPWLKELGKELPESQRKIPPELLSYLCLTEIVQTRSQQISSLPVRLEVEKAVMRKRDTPAGETIRDVEKRYVLAKLYTSTSGLLPLVWAEILYAVENNIFARPCEECGNWFPPHKNQINQQKYCSPACRSEANRKATATKREKEKSPS